MRYVPDPAARPCNVAAYEAAAPRRAEMAENIREGLASLVMVGPHWTGRIWVGTPCLLEPPDTFVDVYVCEPPDAPIWVSDCCETAGRLSEKGIDRSASQWRSALEAALAHSQYPALGVGVSGCAICMDVDDGNPQALAECVMQVAQAAAWVYHHEIAAPARRGLKEV